MIKIIVLKRLMPTLFVVVGDYLKKLLYVELIHSYLEMSLGTENNTVDRGIVAVKVGLARKKQD